MSPTKIPACRWAIWVVVVTVGCVCYSSRGVSAAPDPESLRCLALTVYWESRSEGRDGMVAVGWVILNRLHSADYPKTVCAVVRQGSEQKGCQFSSWCDGESDTPKAGPPWQLAQDVAHQLLTDPPPDPTHGALFYHAVGVVPPWAHALRQTARIGTHVYYRPA